MPRLSRWPRALHVFVGMFRERRRGAATSSPYARILTDGCVYTAPRVRRAAARIGWVTPSGACRAAVRRDVAVTGTGSTPRPATRTLALAALMCLVLGGLGGLLAAAVVPP